jgi:hypothetical protein
MNKTWIRLTLIGDEDEAVSNRPIYIRLDTIIQVYQDYETGNTQVVTQIGNSCEESEVQESVSRVMDLIKYSSPITNGTV